MPSADSSPSPPPIADYELLRQVGRGSYGDVWLARGATGLFRAVKIVWRDRFTETGPYEREFKGLTDFMRLTQGEVRQLALLHVGRDDKRGFFYYVMELADDVVTGNQIDPSCYEPLTLRGLRHAEPHLPAEEVLKYGIELAAGLDELHRAGLLHRDIKPSNIILVDGRPKLADIGLVSTEQDAQTFVGTEGFVPPEGPGTQVADIYSLGKVLYEIATGNDRNDFPRLPTDLSERADRVEYLELNEIIIKAAAPNVAERHPTATALLDELQLLAAGKSVRRLRFAEAGVARARKWILLAVLVAIVAGAGALFERRRADVESAGRRAAESELADLSRRTLHDASLAAAQRALETANYGVAREALERAIPKSGEPDLRGFEWHALYREAQGDPAEILRASGGMATRIEASPNGRWVAIDHVSPEVELYDQQSGKFVRTLEGIHRIAGFSPDGNRLVGTTSDYGIETWSLADGSPDNIAPKPGVNRPIAVHPQKSLILYFEDNADPDSHEIGIWNYETGKTVKAWPISNFSEGSPRAFMTASASWDLSRVLVAINENVALSNNYTIRILDMDTGKFLRKEEDLSGAGASGLDPLGRYFVNRAGSLHVYPIEEGSPSYRGLPFEGTSREAKFSPEGEYFVISGTNNRIIMLRAKSGEVIREFEGSSTQVDVFTFSSDASHIWSVDRTGEIRRWLTDGISAPPVNAEIPVPAEGRLRQVVVDSDSSKLFIQTTYPTLFCMDLAGLSELWRRDHIVSVVYETAAELWVLDREFRMRRLAADSGADLGAFTFLPPETKFIHTATSPNGRLVLAFTVENEIALIDTTERQVLARYSADRLERHAGEFLATVIDNDGRVLTSDIQQTLLLWNASDGSIQQRRSIPWQPGDLNLSPAGDLVIVSTGSKNPIVLSFPELEHLRSIEGGRRQNISYAFHPTRPEVMTQFLRGSLSSLDLLTGNRGAPLEFGGADYSSDLSGMVSQIAFSPDGKKLVTADHLGRIRVWRR